nr:hypothetical protein [Microcoleus vaginatus WJT46-NPBG5]
MQTPTSRNESALSTHKAKSIFASKTFWGVVFTTVAAIAPILREFGLSRGKQIVLKSNGGLFRLVAIGNQSTNDIDQAVDGTAV